MIEPHKEKAKCKFHHNNIMLDVKNAVFFVHFRKNKIPFPYKVDQRGTDAICFVS